MTNPEGKAFQVVLNEVGWDEGRSIPPLSKGPQVNAEALTYSLTTPLYDVNAKHHLGSTCTKRACDAPSRFQRLEGDEVIVFTGVHAHGQKFERSASEQELTAREHGDRITAHSLEDWKKWGNSNDCFVRRTSERHCPLVQAFYSL